MASVYLRGRKWYLRYKDARGRWRSMPSTARTKTEARRLAGEVERRAERERLGLEAPLPEDGGGTLATLLAWWLATCVSGMPSHGRTKHAVERNLITSPLGALHLIDVTPGRIDEYLQSRGDLAPQTLNHLRSHLLTAFNRAKRCGTWLRANPVEGVPRRRVPKRLPDFLRADEVPRVLAALAFRHRPLVATAVYTGARKGELAGLRKSDVDLAHRLLWIRRSYERIPKGGREAAIPIAEELVPFLEQALEASPPGLDLVFPGPDGKMMSKNAPLQALLRRALGRAGIVEHYEHVCRKKGCGHAECASDAEPRRCPTHGHRLWPKAKVRRIRWHDLRHSTASNLMMLGANPAATQRIMRHADPRITTEVYGHLAPSYLKQEIDRLRFGPPSHAVSPLRTPFATTVLQPREREPVSAPERASETEESSDDESARPGRFEPVTMTITRAFSMDEACSIGSTVRRRSVHPACRIRGLYRVRQSLSTKRPPDSRRWRARESGGGNGGALKLRSREPANHRTCHSRTTPFGSWWLQHQPSFCGGSHPVGTRVTLSPWFVSTHIAPRDAYCHCWVK